MAAKKISINPLSDRVLVEPLSEEDKFKKTKAGIVIPETAGGHEKMNRGIVVGVGPGKMSEEGKRLPMSVKKGQTVIFSEYSAEKVKIDGEEYYIIGEGSILAVVE
ncbi:MAG: co-chaperone GroES [Candidatus Pacebacteria bacterium]|nr:co-chaperone GroES [Candidatus Paceibacterota bacterium]